MSRFSSTTRGGERAPDFLEQPVVCGNLGVTDGQNPRWFVPFIRLHPVSVARRILHIHRYKASAGLEQLLVKD